MGPGAAFLLTWLDASYRKASKSNKSYLLESLLPMACITQAIVVYDQIGGIKKLPRRNGSGLLGLRSYIDLEGITEDVNPRVFRGSERLQNNEQYHRNVSFIRSFDGVMWRCLI